MGPIHYMIKPASGSCNMRCKYCFYADEMEKREVSNYGIMSTDTAALLIRQAFETNPSEITFAFQGGEPTMAGLPYFEAFVRMVREVNTKKTPVYYVLQTNGYALNEDWVSLFAREKFLIGLSFDGYRELNDLYRVDRNKKGTSKKVFAAIKMLQNAGVDFNILSVVTAQLAKHPTKVYNYLKSNGLRYQQFIPCLDPLGEDHGKMPYSLTPKLYGEFLKELFDLWFQDIAVGDELYNRTFENWIGMLLGQVPEACGMIGHCSKQMVVEADGRIYPCDFYVLDDYCIGHVRDSRETIEENRKKLGFIEISEPVHPTCAACKWYPICRGGCRRDRDTCFKPDAPLGLNYFCESYRMFFEYAYPRMKWLAEQISRRPR